MQAPDRTLKLTAHAKDRIQERSICAADIETALRTGWVLNQGCERIFVIGHREIAEHRNSVSPCLEGLTVVATQDDRIITAYYDRRYHMRKRRAN